MKAMKEVMIRTAGDREEARWNEVVDDSSDAWIYHRFEWQLVNTSYDAGWKPYYFMAHDENDQIIGVFPTFLRANRLLSLPMGACGPCCRNGVDRQLVRAGFMSYLDEFCEEKSLEAAYMELPNLASVYLPPNERELLWPTAFGFAEWKPHHTYLVNLDSVENMWSRLEKRTRNAVRKAAKSGIGFSLAQSLSDMKDYYSLHLQTYERTGAEPHPLTYFEALWETLFPQDMMRVFFAEYKGRRVAAAIVIMYRDRAVYNSGASLTEFLQYEPNTFLQSKILEFLVGKSFRVYDLGGTDPLSRDAKARGIDLFKRQWGGVLVKGFKGWKEYTLKRKMLKKGFQAYSFIRRRL